MVLRAILVTVGLSWAGALFGGVAGAGAQFVWMVLEGGELFWDPSFLIFGALMGVVAGAFLAPLTAWLLMRHVPLGLAFAGTLLGTVAGAGAGAVIASLGGAIWGGFAGYGISAAVLRFRVPRDGRALAPSTGVRGSLQG
ncbi:MAG TPA: hypothetical protein VF665_19085 [Longimicrobium sp.]|jgi:hypothetical protein|uniref:hypothetical protein n=1 Tax=Longimicrobium sp. TaxID=2029185 RepID=UPI002EDAB714